jgi:hypothetical protein
MSPKLVQTTPRFMSCDTCGHVMESPGERTYLVPYHNLKNSNLALCPACLVKKGYVTQDVKVVYYIPYIPAKVSPLKTVLAKYF